MQHDKRGDLQINEREKSSGKAANPTGEKKEEKSKWYHKRRDQMKTTRKTVKTDKGGKEKSLLELWKSNSSVASNTNDSKDAVILSSDDDRSVTSVNPINSM